MVDPVEDHMMEEHGVGGDEAAVWPCLRTLHRVVHEHRAADHDHIDGEVVYRWQPST